MNHLVRSTFKNKTKIKEFDQLKYICKYLNKSNLGTFEICFGNKLKMDLFDLNLEMLKKLNVRPETVFKINLLAIKLKLLKYSNGIIVTK